MASQFLEQAAAIAANVESNNKIVNQEKSLSSCSSGITKHSSRSKRTSVIQQLENSFERVKELDRLTSARALARDQIEDKNGKIDALSTRMEVKDEQGNSYFLPRVIVTSWKARSEVEEKTLVNRFLEEQRKLDNRYEVNYLPKPQLASKATANISTDPPPKSNSCAELPKQTNANATQVDKDAILGHTAVLNEPTENIAIYNQHPILDLTQDSCHYKQHLNSNAKAFIPDGYIPTNYAAQISLPPQIYAEKYEKKRDLTKSVKNWEVKFSGKNQDVDTFLIRVEECKEVAGMSESDLLRAIPSLLEEPALDLYRAQRTKWKTWNDFKQALRHSYQDEFYSERLHDQIRERIQKPDESVLEFTTSIELLFDKLPEKSDGRKKVERIYRNLRSEFHPLLRPHLNDQPCDFVARAIELDKAFKINQQ